MQHALQSERRHDTYDTAARFRPPRVDFDRYQAKHFLWQRDGKVATVTLNRPERKNPLTLESYAELRDLFRDLAYADGIKTVVVAGAGGNFCSGGDVHEIIGPLVEMQRAGDMAGLVAFTRMTGDLVKAMRSCPQPIIAAVDAICAGAGAILAMASDLRYGTARSKVAFLFVRVGLAGADMGACNMLPRIIGAGRAAELLYTGRAMDGAEAERWGFLQQAVRARWRARGRTGGGPRARRRADVRARDDQALHPPGMEHGDRRGDRGRGAGAGDLHADARLRTRLRGLREEGKAGLRGELTHMDGGSLRLPPPLWAGLSHMRAARVLTSPRRGEVDLRRRRGSGEGVTIYNVKRMPIPPHPIPLPCGERESTAAHAANLP